MDIQQILNPLQESTHFEFKSDGAYFDVDFQKIPTLNNTYRIDFDDRPPKIVRSSMQAVTEVFNILGKIIIDFMYKNRCNIAIPYPNQDIQRGRVYHRLAIKLSNEVNGSLASFKDEEYTYYVVNLV